MAEIAQMTDKGFEFITIQIVENIPAHDDVESSVVVVGQQVLENGPVGESVFRGEKIKGTESMIQIFDIDLAGELRKEIDIGPQGGSQVQNIVLFLVPELMVKDVEC